VQFETADLFRHGINAYGAFQKVLLDPPREGAVEIVKSLPDDWPRRLVYVSATRPRSRGRDAGVLVHTKGFRSPQPGS